VTVARTPFRLEPRPGDVIRGDLWTPPEGERAGSAIAVCHGFKGFKDWGFFPYLSAALAERTGLPTVSFNFSGSGVGDDLQTFGELERFGHNTFSLEVSDLDAVLTGLASGVLGDVKLAPVRRFGLLGHSRGGAAVILTSAARDDVFALATWASISSVEMYERAYADRLEREGVVIIPNARTGQDMPLYRDVLDDIRANRAALDVAAAASRLRAPYLIVHGTEDESVPPDSARVLGEAAGDRGRIVWIEGGSHTMNSAHPFPGPNPALDEAVRVTAEHFATPGGRLEP
jgi:pimeloyl-ACP methyl ester carboxylesterase